MKGEVILLVLGLVVVGVVALPLQDESSSSEPPPTDLIKTILSANPEDNELRKDNKNQSPLLPTSHEQDTVDHEVKKPEQQTQPEESSVIRPPAELIDANPVQSETSEILPRPSELQEAHEHSPPLSSKAESTEKTSLPQSSDEMTPKDHEQDVTPEEKTSLTQTSDEMTPKDQEDVTPEERPKPEPKLMEPHDDVDHDSQYGSSYDSQDQWNYYTQDYYGPAEKNEEPYLYRDDTLVDNPDAIIFPVPISHEGDVLNSGSEEIIPAAEGLGLVSSEPEPEGRLYSIEPQVEPQPYDSPSFESEPAAEIIPVQEEIEPTFDSSDSNVEVMPVNDQSFAGGDETRTPMTGEEQFVRDDEYNNDGYVSAAAETYEPEYVDSQVDESQQGVQDDLLLANIADWLAASNPSSERTDQDDGLNYQEEESPLIFSDSEPTYIFTDNESKQSPTYQESSDASISPEGMLVIEETVPYDSVTRQVPDITNQDDPTTVFDVKDDFSQDTPEDVVVVYEAASPRMASGVDDDVTDDNSSDDNDVSLADFYIPNYSDIRQGVITDDDDAQQVVSPDSVVDYGDYGLYEEEPNLEMLEAVDQGLNDQDILFSKNNPYEDNKFFSSQSDESEQRLQPKEEVVSLNVDDQSTYSSNNMATDISYSTLLDILRKEILAQRLTKANLRPVLNLKDVETLPMEDEYLTDDSDDDNVEIIVIDDPIEIVDEFGAMSMNDASLNVQDPLPDIPWYRDYQQNQRTPYWAAPNSKIQQVSSPYLAANRDFSRRKIPAWFESMDDNEPVPRQAINEPVMMDDSVTFLNEANDDYMPRERSILPISQNIKTFTTSDMFFPQANEINNVRTPKVSFRDLMQQLKPSFYKDKYAPEVQTTRAQYYPHSYNLESYSRFPERYSGMSAPIDYSIPLQSFQDDDFYYPERPQRQLTYQPDNTRSGLYREDTMSGMYTPQTRRHTSDYTAALPYTQYARSRTLNYPDSRFFIPHESDYDYVTVPSSFNRHQYYRSDPYSTGPYYPTPLFIRYAPDYYYGFH